jgi:hypothetical protein
MMQREFKQLQQHVHAKDGGSMEREKKREKLDLSIVGSLVYCWFTRLQQRRIHPRPLREFRK